MRGKRSRLDAAPAYSRIIPAHAGQTEQSSAKQPCRSDHPRACGANFFSNLGNNIAGGSSPRMRGKRSKMRQLVAATRIIPAHAGQTALGSSSRYPETDHPRACGANGASWRESNTMLGSSPRMRGKRHGVLLSVVAFRIIPAHAGQTCHGRRPRTANADHPRACGANSARRAQLTLTCGSSPRMRGKRPHHTAALCGHRIIPAHAGQTSAALIPALSSADHPRACGANPAVNPLAQSAGGSSPRMRGKRPDAIA